MLRHNNINSDINKNILIIENYINTYVYNHQANLNIITAIYDINTYVNPIKSFNDYKYTNLVKMQIMLDLYTNKLIYHFTHPHKEDLRAWFNQYKIFIEKLYKIPQVLAPEPATASPAPEPATASPAPKPVTASQPLPEPVTASQPLPAPEPLPTPKPLPEPVTASQPLPAPVILESAQEQKKIDWSKFLNPNTESHTRLHAKGPTLRWYNLLNSNLVENRLPLPNLLEPKNSSTYSTAETVRSAGTAKVHRTTGPHRPPRTPGPPSKKHKKP